MAVRACVLLLAVVTACGPTAHKKGPADAGAAEDAGTPDAPPLPHDLTQLTVTPTNPLVQLDLNTTGSQDFTVMADYSDGTTEDVTSQVAWSVANPAVGTMAGATLGIPAFAAATAVTSKITATLGGISTDAQITVVAYRQTGTQQDFFFILPYQDPNGPATKPLDFSTAIPALDVFFLMDTTGSMAGEIANLQSGLTNTIIPGIHGAVANSQFGVGALEDFPVSPFGSVSASSDCGTGLNQPDQPFTLKQAITNSVSAVMTGVNALSTGGAPIGCGNDWPEAGIEAIYQAATGDGLTGPAPTSVPANHVGIGGVEFRPGTLPVIVAISDADAHAKNATGACGTTAEAYAGTVAAVAHTRDETKTALSNICARVVGVAAQEPNEDAACTSQSYFDDLATSTGARVPPAAWDFGTRPASCGATQCCTGFGGAGEPTDTDGLCPVVFKVRTDGTDGNGNNGIGASVVTGIEMLTRFATFDVTSQDTGGTTDVDDNPLPAPHTTADFIKAVTPANYTLPPPPPVLPTPTFDATTFHTVTPGTTVGFMVNAFNDFVPQTDQAQIFRATIQVLAGGCTPLDQRDVLILVPPTPIVIQ